MSLRAIGVFLSFVFAAAAVKDVKPAWYMRETAMTDDGRLTFLEKPWWPRAQALMEGESFTLDLNKDGRPDTLIIRKDGRIIEAIDDSGRAAEIWNRSSTWLDAPLRLHANQFGVDLAVRLRDAR